MAIRESRPGGRHPGRGQTSTASVARPGAVTAQLQGCPLVRAAVRTGDPLVVAVVIAVHPPYRCHAAQTAVGA